MTTRQPEPPFRCSAASDERDEPLAGSASTVRAFLLVEHPGPWGVAVLRDARLPEGIGRSLRAASAETGVRILFVRRPRQRPGRRAGDAGGHRVFAVFADPRRPWTEAGSVTDLADLLDLDLADLRGGRTVGLEAYDEPLFCVCTHGRHDACCAERGRPVAAALAEAYPEQTWEISHLGGDRFAANMLVAPDGLYYGRLTPESAVAVAEQRLAGRLELDHLRGRTGYAMSVQAAEIALRQHLGETGLGAVRAISRHVHGEVSEVAFETSAGPGRWLVRIHTTHTDPTLLTCRAGRPNPAIDHEVLDLRPL